MAGEHAGQSVWIGQLGLVREQGQVVDHRNMKERLVTFGNQEYIHQWSCNMAVPNITIIKFAK